VKSSRRTDYVVGGGFAVILHGHLRATRDLDLVIGFAPANVAKACDALAAIGLRPRLPVTFEDFAELSKDAVVKDLDGVPIRVASIAHLIAMKQLAARRQDLDDIEALRQIAEETNAPRGVP